MSKWLLAGVAFAALVGAAPSKAATVTVVDIGSVLNESKALPAEATPGSGIGFAQFFEFSLPTREEVSASVSDSGVGLEQVIGGVLSLNNWTTNSGAPLFIPMGTNIDFADFISTTGGQSAEIAPATLNAGDYFVEVSGASGVSSLKLAIDGTVTAGAVPEPSTWVMAGVGFAFLGWVASRKRRDGLRLAI